MSRKISLNIKDKEIIENLDELCEDHKISISDFVRDAIREKYDREMNIMEIYVIDNNGVKEYSIVVPQYNIVIEDPSVNPVTGEKENILAENEGEISLPNLSVQIGSIYATEEDFRSNSEFREMIKQKGGKVKFFTRKKYKNRKIESEILKKEEFELGL